MGGYCCEVSRRARAAASRSSVGSKPSGKPCPRLIAQRSTEIRDIASKIEVPASPNIGLTIGAPLSQSNLRGEDKAYKISRQSMDLPSRTAAGKAFSNFGERETDSSSAIAADFESSCRLA